MLSAAAHLQLCATAQTVVDIGSAAQTVLDIVLSATVLHIVLLTLFWTYEVLLKQGKGRHLPSTTGDDDQL